jgi:hypothetical protein
MSLKYAPTPQANGKIERLHQFWQRRLPSYFSAQGIEDIEAANPHVDALRHHHNVHETHRELQMTPQAAWVQAKRDKRSVLRPFRPDRWWKYIWSVRLPTRVGLDGCVSIGSAKVRIGCRANQRVLRCDQPDGSISFLANEPGSGGPRSFCFISKA